MKTFIDIQNFCSYYVIERMVIDLDSINERVKELRQNLHMSQEEFGKAIGLSKSGISNIESGARNIRDAHIKLICSSFNVSENWLRTGKDLAAEVNKLEIFDAFLKSLGYVIDMDYDEIIKSHTEDMTDESGNIIGQSKIVDEATYLYHLTKDGKKTTFTDIEFDNFKKEIENSVNFQVWKKQNNL